MEEDIWVINKCSLLEIGICNGTVWAVRRYEKVNNFGGKLVPP